MIDYNTRLLYMMRFFGALTMRYRFRMKAPVDPKALNNAVQKTMKRYPYLGKKMAVRDGAYVLEDNHLPVPVFETRTPMPSFGSEEMKYHLISADYEGNNIYLSILHNLGGGRGMFRWAFSVIYQYIWELTGKDPDIPGIRRPDMAPEPGEELIDPLKDLPEIEQKWKGFPEDTSPMLPSRLEELLKEDREEGAYVTIYTFREDSVMEKVRKSKATPSVWFAVLYYKALIKCLKEIPECIDLGITYDVSDSYGFSESMSLVTRFLHLIIRDEDAMKDVPTLCMNGRAEIGAEKDPGVTNELLKMERDTLIQMEKLPSLQEKAGYYMNHSLIADMVPSTLVSYVGRYDLSGMEDYLESAVVTGFNSTNGILINAVNGCFQAVVAHKYKNAKIIGAFEEVLREQGVEIISAERDLEQNTLKVELPV